jgi:hypothetical protein
MVNQISYFESEYELGDADVAVEASAKHDFHTDGVSMLAPRFEIDVAPTNGQPWRGAFFGGRDALDVVAYSPSPDHLIAVAGGVAYVVPVLTPESYEVISMRPVRLIEASPAAGVAVLVGGARPSATESGAPAGEDRSGPVVAVVRAGRTRCMGPMVVVGRRSLHGQLLDRAGASSSTLKWSFLRPNTQRLGSSESTGWIGAGESPPSEAVSPRRWRELYRVAVPGPT